MKYVFDSGPIINLKYYYSKVFKSFWNSFGEIVEKGEIISAREVLKELEKRGDIISAWAKQHEKLFLIPSSKEIEIVKEILSKHPELIRKKKFLGGLPVADPFIIAQGYCRNLTVVTNETFTTNAHKIPNICDDMGVEYLSFDQFMEKEKWSF